MKVVSIPRPMPMPASTPAQGTDHSVSCLFANLFALFVLAATAAIVTPAFAALWDGDAVDALDAVFGHPMWVVVAVSLASIAAHELLHAVGFRAFGRLAWADMRFGIMWWALAPYASARAPLTARAYRWSALLPGLVLGVVPLLAGLALVSPALTVYGSVMFAAAGGDLAALWGMRRVPADAIVIDSPRCVGCIEMAASAHEDAPAAPGTAPATWRHVMAADDAA